MAQEITARRQETAVRPLSELQELGRVFYESGMFPDIRSAAQAIVKIQAGSELGFSPIYSMAKIYIVGGRVMVGSEALGAMVKRSGRYDYRVVKLTDTECELMFTEGGFTLNGLGLKARPEGFTVNGQDVYLSRFTMEDARRADLVQPNSGWYKWPRAMLMSKALSQGARIVCPHMISGAYVPEDFGVEINENGEVENPESVMVEPRVIMRPPAPEKVECAAENIAAGTVARVAEPEAADIHLSTQATQAQIRKIMASAKSKGHLISDVGAYMKARWNITSTKDLLKNQASEIIDLIEQGKFKEELEKTKAPPSFQGKTQPELFNEEEENPEASLGIEK